jgi:PilZ domain
MPNRDQPDPFDDNWSDQDLTEPSRVNRRKSTRFVRNDIGITLRQIGMFNFNFSKNIDLPVKLVDISSRGVSIATKLRLSVNKKVLLVIRFSDFKEFEIPSTVIRKSPGEMHHYGIKYDSVNNDLANYILKTQKKLTFK